MPFTVSHVAAVLPGYRLLSRWQVFSAAVIGSMAPDFGLFMPWQLRREQTHGILALLTFCLPMGLIVYWLTQLLIKPALVEVLPDRAYARILAMHQNAKVSDPRCWLYAALALLTGAVTHLVWDGFTHEGARGVRMFPMLRGYGPEVAGHSLRLFRLAQHASSALGLLAVIAAVTLWMRHSPPAVPRSRRLPASERRRWLALYIALPLVAGAVMVLLQLMRGESLLASSDVLEDAAIVTVRTAAASLVLTSLLLRTRL